MPTQTVSETTLPPHETRNPFGAAIGIVLALFAIATGLIIAAINPALDGHVIALAAGIGVGMIALAVIATRAVSRLRLPNNNDAWIFW